MNCKGISVIISTVDWLNENLSVSGLNSGPHVIGPPHVRAIASPNPIKMFFRSAALGQIWDQRATVEASN